MERKTLQQIWKLHWFVGEWSLAKEMKHLLILISLLFLTFPTAVYSAQNRVALVIGNGAYRDAPLRNPVYDARLMRNLLRKAGLV